MQYDPTSDPEVLEIQREYVRLCHAMQSGVAAEMCHKPDPSTPKHLRVGVNVAMCDHAALVKLLIDKGVITWSEFYTSLRDAMREEVARYERELSEHYGRKVTLH